MNDEPELNLWMASQGVHGRVLRDIKQIHRVIDLLEPVWSAVKDRDNLERLLTTMEASTARKMGHTEMEQIISRLDYL